MKKTFVYLLLLALLPFGTLMAQDQTDSTAVETSKPERKPVRFSWESGSLIDAQTSQIPPVNSLESVIQHKFGSMENGKEDLWGIYAPGANVRLAINFVPLKNFQIGYGLQKKNMYSDFNAKWTVFQQMTHGLPFSVTLFGNVAIDGRKKSEWESNQYYRSSDDNGAYFRNDYRFFGRLSYFSQLIIGSKLTGGLSLQTGVSFSHFNTTQWIATDNEFYGRDHDKIGVHFAGRLKVSPQGSIICTADIPLHISNISEQPSFDTYKSEPNISFGYEVSTSTHAFQIYAGTCDSYLPQDVMLNNTRKLEGKNFALGFTITRIWGF